MYLFAKAICFLFQTQKISRHLKVNLCKSELLLLQSSPFQYMAIPSSGCSSPKPRHIYAILPHPVTNLSPNPVGSTRSYHFSTPHHHHPEPSHTLLPGVVALRYAHKFFDIPPFKKQSLILSSRVGTGIKLMKLNKVEMTSKKRS